VQATGQFEWIRGAWQAVRKAARTLENDAHRGGGKAMDVDPDPAGRKDGEVHISVEDADRLWRACYGKRRYAWPEK